MVGLEPTTYIILRLLAGLQTDYKRTFHDIYDLDFLVRNYGFTRDFIEKMPRGARIICRKNQGLLNN
jgi:hypothetical protein